MGEEKAHSTINYTQICMWLQIFKNIVLSCIEINTYVKKNEYSYNIFIFNYSEIFLLDLNLSFLIYISPRYAFLILVYKQHFKSNKIINGFSYLTVLGKVTV